MALKSKRKKRKEWFVGNRTQRYVADKEDEGLGLACQDAFFSVSWEIWGTVIQGFSIIKILIKF